MEEEKKMEMRRDEKGKQKVSGGNRENKKKVWKRNRKDGINEKKMERLTRIKKEETKTIKRNKKEIRRKIQQCQNRKENENGKWDGNKSKPQKRKIGEKQK